MSIPCRALVASLAAIIGASPAHAQAVAMGPGSSGAAASPAAATTGVAGLRDAGELCVFDPAARGKLREARILTDPATGDTFAVVRPMDRPIPLGLLFPARRSYVTSRPWFASGAPLTFAGRIFQKHGGPVVLPIAEMRPVGTTADVWLFARTPAAEPGVLYTPSGPGCEFQPYRADSTPVRGARASRGMFPRHRVLGYMTSRSSTGSERAATRYTDAHGIFAAGTADFVITPRHRIGRIESRKVIGGGTDTVSHIVLLRLDTTRNESTSRGRRALLYIHGYNNTFEEAARRAAQLFEDLDYDGDAYFFSWPSRGRTMSYMVDETSVQRAHADFEAAVGRLLESYGAGNVSVIAHSMGHRGFAQAVRDLRPTHPGKLFDQVVLASPDQDVVVFRDYDIRPLMETASRVTVYSSPKDHVIGISRRLHGGSRAGDDPVEVGRVQGIDVIDTSGGSRGGLGHADFAESPAVLGDLYLLLRGRTPVQRALVQFQADSGRSTYWTFPPLPVQ